MTGTLSQKEQKIQEKFKKQQKKKARNGNNLIPEEVRIGMEYLLEERLEQLILIATLLLIEIVIISIPIVISVGIYVENKDSILYEFKRDYFQIGKNILLEKIQEKEEEKNSLPLFSHTREILIEEETIKVSNYELELLASEIYLECRDAGLEEALMVGNVIINRVESEVFPNTLDGVIFQKRQYTNSYLLKKRMKYTEIEMKAAKMLLIEGVRVLPPYVVYQGYIGGPVYCKTQFHTYSISEQVRREVEEKKKAE